LFVETWYTRRQRVSLNRKGGAVVIKSLHLIRRRLRRLGVDVRPATPNLTDFIDDRKIDVVLDVGANVGQFGASLRNKGYRGKIVSFEPLASEFGRLATMAASDGNWDTHHFALGAASGETTINVSDNSVFSSIQPLSSAANEFDGRTVVRRTETIRVRTLDEVFPDRSGNVLLKIDTQGYEKQVLEGGRRLLPRLKGVLLELPIIRIYEGTWKFHEAVEFMASIGFVIAQIEPVSYHTKDKVSLVEVDCLFRPRERQLDC
jgi:FkbM family methyltransferase